MTTHRRSELEAEAAALIENKTFGAAGDKYVQAAFEETGQSFGSATWAMELRMLFKACLCYRLADQERQCCFAAQLGIHLAEEYGARMDETPPSSHPPDRAERGVWHEFVGDFCVVAEFEGVAEAYDSAIDIYREAGNPSAHYAEGPIMSVQAIFSTTVLVAGANNGHITEATQGQLTDWVEYKRERLPDLVETIVSSGEWHLQTD